MQKLDVRIEAHALQNAIRYGKALTGKVIPKILGEFPDEKATMKALKSKIDTIVKDVNTRKKDTLLPRLQDISPDLLEKKEQRRELPELKNAVEGKVVTRLPPEPSKYNHLGHALTFILNAIYAKRYKGKVVLRFEDANPDKVSQEYVDSMLEDIQDYLGIKPDKIHYVSDDMDTLIAYAKELLEKDAAYMCFCARADLSKNRREGTPCDCRDNGKAQHLHDWKQFLRGEYANGEAVLRFKGDMASKNTVLRDPVMFRAVSTPHFRVGDTYKIWPLYDFYSGIEEHLCGVTHVIRSNEFDLRVELQKQLQALLGLTNPEFVHYGRFNLKGATTKGREIRQGIERGQYMGWDDPRLVTLKALKRRGIRKEAYWKLVEDLGLSPYQVNLDFSMLAAKNREVIEPIANRYTFVQDPVEIVVKNVKKHTVTLHLHPDKKNKGRTLVSAGKYLVEKKDQKRFKGKKIRLMGDLTLQEHKGTYTFVSDDVKEGKHDQIVHWLPADEKQTVPVTVMMPDGKTLKGRAERGITKLKVNDIVQFERFGFCRLDEKDPYTFWYTHD